MYLYGVRLGAVIKAVVAANAARTGVDHIVVAALIELVANPQYLLGTGGDTAPAGLALQGIDDRVSLVALKFHNYSTPVLDSEFGETINVITKKLNASISKMRRQGKDTKTHEDTQRHTKEL